MAGQTSLERLIKAWEESPHPTLKVNCYFPAYVELFGHLVNKKCVFIETGILDGGSLFMWRNWLGPEARIIGIDLNPKAKKWEKEGFEIYVGDQGDPLFWEETLQKIGSFDALLDDGGHQSFQQIVTTVAAMKMSKDCVIAIEDTSSSFLKDFQAHGSHSFLAYAKDATDTLSSRFYDFFKGRFTSIPNPSILADFEFVYSIRFYSGIVSFHLNSNFSMTPEVISNKVGGSASDFRYEGKEFAYVKWPTVFSKDKVIKVMGARVRKSKIKERLSGVIPTQLKALIKKKRK